MNSDQDQQQEKMLLVNEQQQVISLGVSSRLIYEGSPCDSFPCTREGWNGGTCTEHRRHNNKKGRRKRRDTVTGNSGQKGDTVADGSRNNSRPNGYTCRCRGGFEGDHCQRRNSNAFSASKRCNPAEVIECPAGMICIAEDDGRKCIYAQKEAGQQNNLTVSCSISTSTSPSGGCSISSPPPPPLPPSDLHLPPPLLLFSGLFFLLIFFLFLLFCDNSSSASFLPMGDERKQRRSRRQRMKKPHGDSKYALIEETEEEEAEAEFVGKERHQNDGDNMEMSQCWSSPVAGIRDSAAAGHPPPSVSSLFSVPIKTPKSSSSSALLGSSFIVVEDHHPSPADLPAFHI